MSWKRLTITFLIVVALLIVTVVFAIGGLMDMYDRAMGRRAQIGTVEVPPRNRRRPQGDP